MGRARRAHLDTAVLISLVIGDEHTRDLQKALYDLARRNIEIVVTHVAAGEALAVLVGRYPDPRVIDEHIHRMINLFRKYRISVEGGILPVRDGSHAIAVRLRGMDGMITGNDLAITAQALADPDSVALVTTDRVLLNSDAISRCEAELRDSGARNVKMIVVRIAL